VDSTEWLRLELTKRRAKNPAFSLRSFARLLDVQPGRLSEYMARKRPFTERQVSKFADKLAIHPKEIAHLTGLRSARSNRSPNMKPSHNIESIDQAHFEIISQPTHYHVLSTMELDGYDGSPKWLSSRLGADVGQIRSCLERLQTVGLVRSEKSGQWSLCTGSTMTTTDVPSAALRASHRASIEHAMVSLDEIAIDLRDITSITMAIDPKRLKIAKAMIKRFRSQLASKLEVGDRSEVYELNIQLVPVSKKRRR